MNNPYEFKSLYPGYAEAQRILGKPNVGGEQAAPETSGISFTLLLDDLMPGLDLASQVRQWNKVTGELNTVASAEARILEDQTIVKVARMSWDNGLERERRNIPTEVESHEPAARPDVLLR